MNESLDRPKTFRVNDEALTEVIRGALFMKHAVGEKMSIALFKFLKGKGNQAPAETHSHGEEVGLVLKGTARIFGTDGSEYVLKAGDAIILPAGWEHSGTFDDDEECLIFCVGSPPRFDLGPESVTSTPLGFEKKE
jgi:quercetin dioxygenase-like cupin family protein